MTAPSRAGGFRFAARIRARGWWPLHLRDVVVFSLPFVFWLVYLYVAAIVDFSRTLQWRDSTPYPGLPGYFTARLRRPLDFLRSAAISRHLDPERDEPGLLRIDVPRAAWDGLHRDQQGGWGMWIEALQDRGGGELHRIRIRKRGDISLHWSSIKRSFTIRTRKDDLFRGYRQLGLSNKQVLMQYVANRLPRWFDVMRPFSDVTPVFVNNQFYGVFRAIARVDESFLRRQGRMPGNIYRGDAAERGDYFKYLPRDLFSNPYIWDRTAINDRPGAPPGSGLIALLDDLNGGTFDDHRRLMARLDRHEVAEGLALQLIVGDPFHMDGVHNQFWYEDPATGLMHQVPWDLRILRLDRPRRRLNRLTSAMLRDPFVVDETLRVAWRALTRDSIVARADSMARDIVARDRNEFRYDRARRAFIPDVGSPETLLPILHDNERTLRAWAADARVESVVAGNARSGWMVDLVLRGHAGANLTGFVLPGPARPSVRIDRNRNGRADPEDRPIPGRMERAQDGWIWRPEVSVPLYAAWATDAPGIRSGVRAYRLLVSGTRNAPTPILKNRVTGAAVEPDAGEPGTSVLETPGWHAWQYPAVRPGRTRRWQGTVRIRETVTIEAQDTLIIAPGTTVLIDPERSLVSYGYVDAAGTTSRPIRIRGSSPTRPWGAFVLQGPGADGSRLVHVDVTGGGGAVIGRIEYTGMVNVHQVRGFQLRSAHLHDNLRSDDTFHAVHAEVLLADCTFENANADAVDLDYSTGTIRGCRFQAAANDAIDLMTSDVDIVDVHIAGSGDKGVSVGEASRPRIIRTTIVDGVRGIEVKDRSRPLIVGSRIAGNRIGLLQTVKNWRYGGSGWAMVLGSTIRDNGIDVQGDAGSRLTTRWTAIGDTSSVGERAGGGEPGEPEWWWTVPGGLTGSAGNASDSLAAVEYHGFHEDFRSLTDGWTGDGGVVRLVKRNDALVASLRGGPATVGRDVAWDCTDADRPCLLVIELAARRMREGRIAVQGERVSATVGFPDADSLPVYRLVALPLPPGRYRRLEISGRPRAGTVRDPGAGSLLDPRAGRLLIGGYTLYRRSPDSPGGGP